MEKIKCIFHEEQTPSLVIYPNGYRCFGCGAAGPLSDLGRATTKSKPRYIEDIQKTLRYINELPRKKVRGFDFKYDSSGYYLVWPGGAYYKRRSWQDEGSKYKCPSGHAQPMFIARRMSSQRAFLVEGEFNAMSIADAFPNDDVFSPGSATEFGTPRTRKFLLTYCTYYCTVVVVADRDGAGTEAAIQAKGTLLGKVTNIPIVLMSKDANEIYCEQGQEGLKEAINQSLSNVQERDGRS